MAAILLGGFFVASSPAKACDEPIQKFLVTHHSPLPWWTIAAFKEDHPDFDISGYLAVAWAESSLGTAGRLNNPGSIKGGTVGTVWRDLRIGSTASGYNRYGSMYDGQRALIRLLYERGYNAQLAAHDWTAFANRYYGSNVPGKAAYIRTLRAAHALIVKEAASLGAAW